MERVAFLLEKSGERIPCLLNPTSVVVRRMAGIRARQSGSGPLTGAALKDDPLLHTGGGMTEILLDLLFDVSLAGTNVTVEDVRDLTRPLTELAEGSQGDDGYGQIPVARFIWSNSWNVRGVVAAVAERLEYFTPEGAPQRSWLRMRFLRADNEPNDESATMPKDLQPSDLPDELDVPPDELRLHQIKGAGQGDNGQSSTERLDEIATSYYGNPAWWRLIAAFNNIDNPWDIKAGTSLNIPPATSVERQA
jgi:hypothetical protein